MLLNEEQKRRYTAFWNRELSDRACLSLSYWGGGPGFRPPVSVEEQWGGLAYREERTVYEADHVRKYAEGFQSVFVNFGPGCLTACIGGNYRFAPDTVWFENPPLSVGEWENRLSPKLNPDSAMYRMVDELTERYLRHTDKIVTSVTDIGGTYDIVAALRGTENLLYDMYDNPEEVKALRDEVAPIWKRYFLHYTDRLFAAQGCMTSWMPIWSDKTYYPLQCDYSAMLSPAMFREFILPDLREQTEYMDRSIYHLDGIGELPHLDMILSLPRLNAIQWVSGSGKAPVTDPCWFDLYHRIQAAGKGIVLLGADPAGLENLFQNVSQRGLFLDTWVRDEADAKEIVSMAEKLNH